MFVGTTDKTPLLHCSLVGRDLAHAPWLLRSAAANDYVSA